MYYLLSILQVGRLLRFIGFIKKIVTKLNTSLKFVTSGALLIMFWVKISQATAKGDLQKFSPLIIFVVTAFGIAVITSFLIATFIFCTLLRLPRKSVLPLTVLSSARHSSIAIAVIENLPPNVGDKDLMFFPIIFVYLSMIVIINCYAAFMKVKEKEMNNFEQDMDMFEDKSSSNVQTEKQLEGNVEIEALLKPVKSVEKLTVANINQYEQLPLHEMVKHNASITLPMTQWSTAV